MSLFTFEDLDIQAKFEDDCIKWRGRILRGGYAHWCFSWDGLPLDETCEEWPCDCYSIITDPRETPNA